MPLGGSNISWVNATPAGSESLGLGDNRIRSMKTSVQEGLDNEHNWPATGGAATGYHKFGSARAHFGTQSRVSASEATDARLMVTSDSSRLFAINSDGTMLVGGRTVPLVGPNSAITVPQRVYWGIEHNISATGVEGLVVVTFANSGFSSTPTLVANIVEAVSASTASSRLIVSGLDSSGVTFAALHAVSNTSLNRNVHWTAIGPRTL